MENFINWFEIPSTDFKRAVTFYKGIFSIEIQEIEMFGTQMGLLPSDGQNVSGAVIHGEGYEPSSKGPLLYLNGGENLQDILDKVEAHHGKIIVPKTQISPDMGYFALFIDTEGNKLGLHSMQ